MLKFAKRTEERGDRSMMATGNLGDLFLKKTKTGRVNCIQFSLIVAGGEVKNFAWHFDVAVPEQRIRKVRDELYRQVRGGNVRDEAMLEALRLKIRELVRELAIEDARRALSMV